MDLLSKLIVTDIEEAFTVKAPKGRHIKITDRSCYGLSFCISGKITYSKYDKKTVSDPSCAIILPMGQTYELYNNLGGEFPVINFKCLEIFTSDIIAIPISGLKSYLRDYEKIKSLLLFPDERLKIIGVFYEILARLSREDKKEDTMLNEVIEYINNNFCDVNINNSVLAKKANISEVYMRRIFKEKFHTSPKQYILEMRIKLAKQMLAETTKSVSALSFECGFSNTYHFCRIFKEKTGLTPMEYRRIYRL